MIMIIFMNVSSKGEQTQNSNQSIQSMVNIHMSIDDAMHMTNKFAALLLYSRKIAK